eukprot:EG_transcript_15208
MVECSEDVVRGLKVARAFKPSIHSDKPMMLNSLDFSDDCRRLVTCDDRTIRVYNVEDGCHAKDIPCKKYGVNLVRFTHHADHVLLASKNGWDETIRHLALKEYQFLQYFTGHRDKVVSLEVSPVNDTFLSGSLDGMVRLWDLKSRCCQGQLSVKGRAAVAFDPNGLVFAVSSSFNVVRLFDTRHIDQGPFATFAGQGDPSLDVMHLRFSPDGNRLLCATNENYLFLLDAFNGRHVQQYTDHQNGSGCSLEPSFTADGKFVASGSEDGSVYVWETETGRLVCRKEDCHAGPVGSVRFNPKYLMAASCCYNLVFWANPELCAG